MLVGLEPSTEIGQLIVWTSLNDKDGKKPSNTSGWRLSKLIASIKFYINDFNLEVHVHPILVPFKSKSSNPLLFFILANVTLLVKMIKVAGVVLPKLDLVRVMVVKEALSVHFSVRNAFARLVAAAGFHAAFKC